MTPSSALIATLIAVVANRSSAVVAEGIASTRGRTTAIEVHRRAVIVFAPSKWVLDAKSDAGAAEAIAHVRFAIDDVNKCKGPTSITVRMAVADRLIVTLDGKRKMIDLAREFPNSAGAYLFKSGTKPRSIATSNDTAGFGDVLSRAVGEFFGLPGCLDEG